MLKFRVPAGIGDISWAYSKLHNFNEPLHFFISDDEPRRALEFCKMLPNVAEAEYAHNNFHELVDNSFPARTPKKEILKKARMGPTNFCPNRHLEAGNRLDTYIPELETTLHYSLKTPNADITYAENTIKTLPNTIGIYPSSYHTAACWNGWHLKEWKDLICLLYQKYPTLNFVLIGAHWDQPFCHDLSNLITGIPHVNLAGHTSIGCTLEIIRRLTYFISFPSGLPIMANVLRTPTFMFFPLHLGKLFHTFADPIDIHNRFFTPSFFESPLKVFHYISEIYRIGNLVKEVENAVC